MKRFFNRGSRSLADNRMYYTSNYYYEKIKSQYSRLDAYRHLASFKNKQPLPTDYPIIFSQSPEFEKNPKRFFTLKYGKPNHTVVIDHVIGKVTVLIYRIYLGDHKTTLELHFHKDQMIMHTYRFSYLSKKSGKQYLIDLLKDKYHIDSEVSPSDHCIVDDEDRMIVISDTVDFSINYVNFVKTGFLDTIESIHQKFEQWKRVKRIHKEQELAFQL